MIKIKINVKFLEILCRIEFKFFFFFDEKNFNFLKLKQ